jgi:hypothetical protein
MPWLVMAVERDRVVTALEKQGTGTPRCIDIPTHGCVLRTAYTAGTAIRHIGQLPVAGRQTVAHSTLAPTAQINEHQTAPKYTLVKIS